jgi:hypothetical protein
VASGSVEATSCEEPAGELRDAEEEAYGELRDAEEEADG